MTNQRAAPPVGLQVERTQYAQHMTMHVEALRHQVDEPRALATSGFCHDSPISSQHAFRFFGTVPSTDSAGTMG